MSPLRSFTCVALFTVIASAAAGCKKDETTPAKPEASAASSNARDKGKMSLRNPMAPTAKIDPQTMKEYRMDVCYFGTQTLRQARDAYLASLGKDEPSEKKIPSFGGAKPGDAKPPMPGASGAPKPPPPAASTGAKPPGGASTGAKPPGGASTGARSPGGASTAATPPPGSAGARGPGERDMRRPFDVAMRAPHERNARACTVAAGHKDPAMPEVDPAVADFAPYAVELAKNIAAASTYYQREEYKKDGFAKGKELHKKLVDDFAKLDEKSDKLGAAIDKWHKEHPADASKLEEAQKLASAGFDDARAVMLGAIGKKPDPAAHKAGVEKLEKSAEALKSFGSSHQTDAWPKIMTPAFDAFVKAAKEAGDKITDKGLDNDAFLSMITSFTSLVESKQRALSRSMIAKGQTNDPTTAPAGRPMPAGSGAPDPAEHKKDDDHGH
ncbi:MAG: DUF3829 domain-containing protein [Polyangiaceae bacterium]